MLATPHPVAPRRRGPRSLSRTLLATAATVALLYYGRGFLITLISAVILAFLLEPAVAFLVRLRLRRSFASLLVCATAALMLYLAAFGLFTQAAGFADDLPRYGQRVSELVDNTTKRVEEWQKAATALLVPKRLQEPPGPLPGAEQSRSKRRQAAPPTPAPPTEVRVRSGPPLFATIYTTLNAVYDTVLLVSFVPFLVYFLLSWRDHVRRSLLHVFAGRERAALGRTWQGVSRMARGYVVGNFLLGICLALASTGLFWLLHLPYALLVGLFSGFLSLVPYVGLPLALLPPWLAAVDVYNGPTAYLVVAFAVAVLHILAMNVLYPKLVGARVHLNPLAVTVALMFWGTLWGGAGLVLAVPLTAAVKTVCDGVPEWEAYGRLLGDGEP